MANASHISAGAPGGPVPTTSDKTISSNMINGWSRRKVESRRKLLAAARKLFAERGYHHIRTQDISAEANVGYGTFYLQFEDKLDCFRAVIEEASEELRSFMNARVEGTRFFPDQIRAMLSASFDYSLANPGVLRTIVVDTRILSNQETGPFTAPKSQLRQLIEKWQCAGDVNAGFDPQLVRSLILCAIKQGDALIRDSSADKDLIIENIAGFLIRGLKADVATSYDEVLLKDRGKPFVKEMAAKQLPPSAASSEGNTKSETCGKLLAAARTLFAEHGYDSVKPKEISELAGVGVGTFYSYFEDKLDCFLAVTNEAAEELFELSQTYTAGVSGFANRLGRLLQASFDYSAANPGLYRAIVADVRVLAKNRKRPVKRGLDALLRYLEDGKKAGDITTDFDSRVLAFLIAGSVNQGDDFILNFPARRDSIIEDVTRFVCTAISAR